MNRSGTVGITRPWSSRSSGSHNSTTQTSRRPISSKSMKKKKDNGPVSSGSDDSSMGTAPTWLLLSSSSSLNVGKDDEGMKQQRRQSISSHTSITTAASPAAKVRVWHPQSDRIASLWSSHSSLPLGSKSDHSCSASRTSRSTTKSKKEKKSRRGIPLSLNLNLSSEVLPSPKSQEKKIKGSSVSLSSSSRRKQQLPPLPTSSASLSTKKSSRRHSTPTFPADNNEPIAEQDSSIWKHKVRHIESTQELRLKENGCKTRFQDASCGYYVQQPEDQETKDRPLQLVLPTTTTKAVVSDTKKEVLDNKGLEDKKPSSIITNDCEQRENSPLTRTFKADHPLLEMIIEIPTTDSNEDDDVSLIQDGGIPASPPTKEATIPHTTTRNSPPKKMDEIVAPFLDMIIEVPVTPPSMKTESPVAYESQLGYC